MSSQSLCARIWVCVFLFATVLWYGHAGIIYVDKDASGANNGSSWSDAFTSVSLALTAAITDDEIWVRKGEYFEGSLQLKTRVGLYGGFATTETQRQQRDWQHNLTVINGTGHYHVIIMDSITSAVLDGFTITGGNANGSWPDDEGGALHCLNVNNTNVIANNVIVNNSAWWQAGGIYCSYSSPQIKNNQLRNSTANWAAGIYCEYSAPEIIGNLIEGNVASIVGGGIMCDTDSDPEISFNTIRENYAYNDGGGLLISADSAPSVRNNYILNNTASTGAGIYIYFTDTAFEISNNVIAGNYSDGFGGGIDCAPGCSALIQQNIIIDNYAEHGGGIYCENAYATDITGNFILANIALYDGGGVSCGGEPLQLRNNLVAGNNGAYGAAFYCAGYNTAVIVNNTVAFNYAGTNGGAVWCSYYSNPTIRNNIFAHNNQYDILEDDTDSDPSTTYNNFWGNSEGCYYDEGSTPYTSVALMDSSIAECGNNIGENPLFIGDTLSTSTWTADSSFDSVTYQTTLFDANATWTSGSLTGKVLNPDLSQNRQFYVCDNAATTITIWGDASGFAKTGDIYRFFDYHLQNIMDGYPQNSPSIDAGDPADDYSQEPLPHGYRINQGRYGNTSEAARTYVYPRITDWYLY